ncbi:hypothetical protein ABES02_10345 [Neobacillus pocheonensis]|uniref:hypothetical protein n=1 Tax=Neobacillus pocheonensis TaxID=363869 RepID=UPI003D2DA06F
MISILNNVAKRAKKWMILLIILPLLTGVVSYVMEKRTPQTYTAQTTIELGNFENTRLTDPKFVASYLKSTNNLKKMQKDSGIKFNTSNVKNRINATPSESRYLPIVYTGTSKEEAEKTLTAVVDAFIKESDIGYDRKNQKANELFDKVAKTSTQYEAVNQKKVLYELWIDISNLVPTIPSEPVTVTGSAINPVKKGIFGLILGLMLDVAILVIPELFREYR